MKKILLVILTLCLLGGCFKFTKGEVNTKRAKDVLKMFENKESFILYAGSNDCNTCNDYRQVLQELIKKYEIEIIYLNTKVSEDEEIINTLTYDYLYRLYMLPSTYLIKDGKTIDMKEIYMELEQLEEWLKQYEYLPE
ncbi:MAG TPA: hypothetical protein PLT36_06610 [Erysipelotrichaceae bacterium]|jgi:predicted bacteriocin transport accessory protein|nr:hypothetical protein [Erysipelotrichia bacterium]HPX33157.1 hypothetical protein [Erysipelotrichaceae bacterium]HQA85581.1 hypothetical protein [Erysipelotrichaceae bacterium]